MTKIINRKIALLVAALLLVTGIAIIAAGLLQKDADPIPQKTNEASKPALQYLTDSAVIAPSLSHKGDSVWYFTKADGELYSASLEEEREPEPFLLPQKGEPRFVLWPQQGSDIILGTADGIFYYNAASAKMTRYPDTLRTIAWMPDGQRIAYVWSDEKGTVLSVARPDLSDYKNIAPLPHAGFRVEPSPNSTTSAGSFILFNPSAADNSYLVVNNIPALQELQESMLIKDVTYSPNAKGYLFVQEEGGRRSLYVSDTLTQKTSKVGDLAEGGGYSWSRDGSAVYWSDSSRQIKRIILDSGVERSITENIPGAQVLVASEVIPGRNDNEILFVEHGSGRLGRLVYE